MDKLVGKIERIISQRVEYHYQDTNEDYMIGSPKILAQAISDFIKGELPGEESCKEGEQYWMWNSVHNVYEYGKLIGHNNCLSLIKQKLGVE